PGPARWLLFLARSADGSWHVQTGGRDENVIKLDASNAAIVAETARLAGGSGAEMEPESPADQEIGLWIKQAGTGSRNTRRESFARLLAAGDSARPQLLTASSSADREVANAARTLAALTGGGHAVNGLRLILEPASLALKDGEKRVLTVQLANLTDRDIRVVTGQGAWGEVVRAASGYEVRVQGPMTGSESGGTGASGYSAAKQPPLPTVLPKTYGVPSEGSGPPLPLVRVVPSFGTLPLAVEVELERATVAGKDVRRLKFPHGYIVLEGSEKYSVRVHFDCPGPRLNQQRLIEANYWAGGQLVSNDVTLGLK
ncbi:MAG: hypothetical protein NTW87_33375, partial [Planctomycetota bacterium]|nr:hypothetical protein [Planctomycetota bacterium]